MKCGREAANRWEDRERHSFYSNPSWSFIRSLYRFGWCFRFSDRLTRRCLWFVFRDFAVLWYVRLLLFNILSFAWIWVYFRFSVWFESQTFIRLTSNRLKDREFTRFCLYLNISNLVDYVWVCVFSVFRLAWNWTVFFRLLPDSSEDIEPQVWTFSMCILCIFLFIRNRAWIFRRRTVSSKTVRNFAVGQFAVKPNLT